MTAVRVIAPSPIVLPEDAPLRRVPPRPPEDRQPGYSEAFDDRTVWYDAFRHDGDIVLAGPPLRNLRAPVLERPIRLDEAPVDPARVELADLDRTQHSRIHRADGERLSVLDGTQQLSAVIGADHRDLFAGLRVIVTLTAGGRRTRPDEWLAYHQRAHGIDAALVYVNNRAAVGWYQDRLAAAGLKAAVVVAWPFQDGPTAGPGRIWDSDFSYYSVLEHARLRFLQRAAGVLSVNVDQLVLTDDRRSIFALAQASPHHLVRFSSIRVESAVPAPRLPRRLGFADFGWHRCATSPPRWALIPDPATSAAGWRIHTVRGVNAPVSARATGREFTALGDRPAPPRRVLPGLDRPDHELAATLVRYLGRGPAPSGPAPGTPSPAAPTPPARSLWRSLLRRDSARPSAAETTVRADAYDYVFVMTYGRSGSTLVQGILSSIPGYLIRGENKAMMYALYSYHRTSLQERRRLRRTTALPPTHPFYGIDGYPDEVALRDIRTLALHTILRPESGTRVVGFKEIDWSHGDLVDYVRFLRTVFPGARFVVNTRDHDEVMRSKWWARRRNAAERIKAAEDRILEAAEALDDAAYHIHYNDYVDDPAALRGLYAWLGEPFDLEAVQQAMGRRYSY